MALSLHLPVTDMETPLVASVALLQSTKGLGSNGATAATLAFFGPFQVSVFQVQEVETNY